MAVSVKWELRVRIWQFLSFLNHRLQFLLKNLFKNIFHEFLHALVRLRTRLLVVHGVGAGQFQRLLRRNLPLARVIHVLAQIFLVAGQNDWQLLAFLLKQKADPITHVDE